jgi:hypothetical protein
MKKVAWTFLLVPIFGQVLAQEVSGNKKSVVVDDFSIKTGFLVNGNPTGSLTDFRTLAPQSNLLQNEFSGFNPFFNRNESNVVPFSVLVGLQFRERNAPKKHTTLRLGLSYLSGHVMTISLNERVRVPFDTLTSGRTESTILVDSIYGRNYFMNYSANQLRFDASLIFRTSSESRWNLFAGLGFSVGFSLNAFTEVFFSENSRLELDLDDFNPPIWQSTNLQFVTERHNNRGFWATSVFIPVGVDFRMGQQHSFWGNVHLFYELRPSLNFISIPELRTLTLAGAQHGFGLRYNI